MAVPRRQRAAQADQHGNRGLLKEGRGRAKSSTRYFSNVGFIAPESSYYPQLPTRRTTKRRGNAASLAARRTFAPRWQAILGMRQPATGRLADFLGGIFLFPCGSLTFLFGWSCRPHVFSSCSYDVACRGSPASGRCCMFAVDGRVPMANYAPQQLIAVLRGSAAGRARWAVLLGGWPFRCLARCMAGTPCAMRASSLYAPLAYTWEVNET